MTANVVSSGAQVLGQQLEGPLASTPLVSLGMNQNG